MDSQNLLSVAGEIQKIKMFWHYLPKVKKNLFYDPEMIILGGNRKKLYIKEECMNEVHHSTIQQKPRNNPKAARQWKNGWVNW